MAFKLKSGNKPSGFKMMGSSPVKGVIQDMGKKAESFAGSDAGQGALAGFASGGVKGALVGGLTSHFANKLMNKKKKEGEPKKDKGSVDMSGVADNLKKASPNKKGFMKKAGDAYMGALKTSGEGFLKGGPLGAIGAMVSAGMNKDKDKNKAKPKENKGNLDMTGVAENLVEKEKASPNKSTDDKLKEVKINRSKNKGNYNYDATIPSNPDIEEQLEKNQTVVKKATLRKEETPDGVMTEAQLKANQAAEDKKKKKKEKKKENKASRKEWRKGTAKKIGSKALEIGSEAATNALTNALTPKETKRVNPTAGFNVQFGNKR